MIFLLPSWWFLQIGGSSTKLFSSYHMHPLTLIIYSILSVETSLYLSLFNLTVSMLFMTPTVRPLLSTRVHIALAMSYEYR